MSENGDKKRQKTEPKVTHKTALITGITGQDGSYLAELLLGKIAPAASVLVLDAQRGA